jgi:two-component system, NarL family, nitrate/nitrite sensor histidine kinase NarX
VDQFTQKVQKVFNSRWLPWVAVGITLLVALLHETVTPAWIRELSHPVQAIIWGLAWIVLFLAYLIAERVFQILDNRQVMQQRLIESEHRIEQAEGQAAQSAKQLEAIFTISQKTMEAGDENQVIQILLRFAVDLTVATGATFVPLDEHGQPATTVKYGRLPPSTLTPWLEHLASPAVRERCQSCRSLGVPVKDPTCPLITGPFQQANGVFCLVLQRREREYGVLNLFLNRTKSLDQSTQVFLHTLVDQTALAIESIRLRRQELAVMNQIRAFRQKSDLNAILTDLLENVQQTLESDFATLLLPKGDKDRHKIALVSGEYPPQVQPFLDGMLHSVITSGEALVIGDLFNESPGGNIVHSLLVAPLLTTDHQTIGAILVGSHQFQAFDSRQLALLQTLAGQATMVIQDRERLTELEYKTILQERVRLSREIHDGLAQTLGFLKLQTAQMQGYLARNDLKRLDHSLSQNYLALNEAYQDARQAIDGLRLDPEKLGIIGGLKQTVEDFREMTGLPVSFECDDLPAEPAPEISVQLIRIAQEALSNVRKHAQAKMVQVSMKHSNNDLWMEVSDNGQGFSPDDVIFASRHGLRGMYERSELISAELQVISSLQEGTTVRLRLPSSQTNLYDQVENLAES